jgi:hypothetical protein
MLIWGVQQDLPESDAVTLSEVLVAFFPRFVEALEVFGTKFNGEALDVLWIVAPALDGDFSERLFGAEEAACQWHKGMVAGVAVGVVSAECWRRPDRTAGGSPVSSRVRRGCRSSPSGCGA